MAQKRVKNYDYIKRSDISVLKATVDGKVLNVDPKKILSGTYVAGKVTPTAKKLRVAKIDPFKLKEKIFSKAKEIMGNEYETEYEKFVLAKDLKAFIECGLTEEMIMAFYLGFKAVVTVTTQGEYADYGDSGGIFGYRTDGGYIERAIERAIYNCENKCFEIGFKYPDFNWKKAGMKISKTEVVETPEYDFMGKKVQDILKIETFTVKKTFKVLAVKSVGRKENGELVSSSSYGTPEERDPKKPLDLNGGYLAIVSRNAKDLFALAIKLLTQENSYTKDFDWLIQTKTDGARTLNESGFKYAKGGEIPYMDEVYEANRDRQKSFPNKEGIELGDYVKVVNSTKGGIFSVSKGQRGRVYGMSGGNRPTARFITTNGRNEETLTENLVKISKEEVSKGAGYYAKGGKVDEMVKNYQKYGWAKAHINDDTEDFFERIGVPYDEIGTTSEVGTDIIFYDTKRKNRFNTSWDRYAKGGEIPSKIKKEFDKKIKNKKFAKAYLGVIEDEDDYEWSYKSGLKDYFEEWKNDNETFKIHNEIRRLKAKGLKNVYLNGFEESIQYVVNRKYNDYEIKKHKEGSYSTTLEKGGQTYADGGSLGGRLNATPYLKSERLGKGEYKVTYRGMVFYVTNLKGEVEGTLTWHISEANEGEWWFTSKSEDALWETKTEAILRIEDVVDRYFEGYYDDYADGGEIDKNKEYKGSVVGFKESGTGRAFHLGDIKIPKNSTPKSIISLAKSKFKRVWFIEVADKNGKYLYEISDDGQSPMVTAYAEGGSTKSKLGGEGKGVLASIKDTRSHYALSNREWNKLSQEKKNKWRERAEDDRARGEQWVKEMESKENYFSGDLGFLNW